MTPAQASGLDLNLGRNRWLELLKKSLQSDGMGGKSSNATKGQNETQVH